MTRASDTARLVSGGAVFNEASNDVDFRVESNGNENMLVVNDMELKLYSKIKIDITCLPYETKFNKKLYIRIVDLNCLGDV